VHDNPSSPGPKHRAGSTARLTGGPRADATRLHRHLKDLARSGPKMPRAFAARRAESVIVFLQQHEADFARAGLPVERRASLVVRSATLRDAIASQNWDEVRVTAGEIAMDLGAYVSAGPIDDAPPTPNSPVSRTAGLIRQFRRSLGGRARAVDLEPADNIGPGPAEDAPAKTAPMDGTDVAPNV
jgi:hypothetical protein